ncbi:MAG TPA: hypothetical protein PLM00_07790 [Spirochaetota bacterium]|nr:hypothetical protein [Spirochaetota bacterium]HPN83280.1 hypothetical protein [Spirochaetota bacterium]
MSLPRTRDIHDGHLAMRLRPPFKRVDWNNDCRDKTIFLFGKQTWVDLLTARIRKSLEEHRP